MISYKKLLEMLVEGKLDDYKGEHLSPDNESGSPLHNICLNKTFPDDVYSTLHHYKTGDDISDTESISKIQQFKNKPLGRVKVYRAIPKILSQQEQIDNLESQKKYILKYGKMPRNINSNLHSSDYYSKINDDIENLKKLSVEKIDKMSINHGDWVSLSKNYAIDHGKSNLNNNYKILSKTVFAKHLYTDGDINEWGYHPNKRI